MMTLATIQIQAIIHISMIDEVVLARRKENVVCTAYFVLDEEIGWSRYRDRDS